MTRGPRIGGPGPWACGLTVWIGPSNPCRWPMTRAELSCANLAQATPKAGRRCVLYGPWTVALGPRSTGLGKMVQYPRDKFYVAKWGVFCHPKTLQSRFSYLKCFASQCPAPLIRILLCAFTQGPLIALSEIVEGTAHSLFL